MADEPSTLAGPPKTLAPAPRSPQDRERVNEKMEASERPTEETNSTQAKSATTAPVEPKTLTPAPDASSAEPPAAKPAPQPVPASKVAVTPNGLRGLIADSAAMQGRRPKQEDRHVKIPDLTKAAKALKMPIDHLDQPCALFAVYDGHQGHLCAEFVAKGFHTKLLKRLSGDTNIESWTDERITAIFHEMFEELDSEFLARYRTSPDGCTVVVAFLTGERLFVAWVGDSRCLLCRRTSRGEIAAVSLTEDHRPSRESEASRVKKAGGIVVDFGGGVARVAHEGYDERVRELRRAKALGLGTIGKEPVALAVSRALGDREFKAVTGKALLVPTPDVRCIRLERSHKFIALMCDGIPDVMRNEEAVWELDFAREEGNSAAGVRAACGALVQEAYKRGSEDNLTVIMVRFDWDGAEKEASSRPSHGPGKALAANAPPESAVAASKRRRLEAANAVSAQRVAAYERAVSAAQVDAQKPARAADQAVPFSTAAALPQDGADASAKVELSIANSNGSATRPAQSPATAEAAPEPSPKEPTIPEPADEDGGGEGVFL